MRPTSKPRTRKIPKYLFCHGAPDEVVGRAFALPDDLSLSGDFLDWGPEYDAKIRLPKPAPPLRIELRGALTQAATPTREEWVAAETERVLKLPPAEFKKWLAEQQQRNDAMLANLMPWGGAV